MDLSRRQVLRGAGAGVGAAALGSGLATPARAAIRGTDAPPAPVSAARSYDFDQDWRFVLVNADGVTDPTGAYSNAYQPGFDDSSWRRLDVPHDWSIELAPAEGAGTISGNGFFKGGLAWYRKTFTLPPAGRTTTSRSPRRTCPPSARPTPATGSRCPGRRGSG